MRMHPYNTRIITFYFRFLNCTEDIQHGRNSMPPRTHIQTNATQTDRRVTVYQQIFSADERRVSATTTNDCRRRSKFSLERSDSSFHNGTDYRVYIHGYCSVGKTFLKNLLAASLFRAEDRDIKSKLHKCYF